jgi:hypothetical protein
MTRPFLMPAVYGCRNQYGVVFVVPYRSVDATVISRTLSTCCDDLLAGQMDEADEPFTATGRDDGLDRVPKGQLLKVVVESGSTRLQRYARWQLG